MYSMEGEKELELSEVETYTLPLEELIKRLKTDIERGLDQKEVERRLAIFGPNVIPKIKPSLFKVYIAPLLNWLINIYLIISTILAVFAFLILPEIWGQVIEWLSVIAVNAALAIVQQARAQTKLEALQRLSAPKSKVIREGKIIEIPSEQIVPGDIIKLDQGDRVPADARIISASSLRVNEAPLTGESEEVEKFEHDVPLDKDTPLSRRKNMVFLGTYVTAGSATALVVKTGRQTEIGKISKDLEELSTGEIPLRQKVNRLAKYLGLAVVIYLSIAITYNMFLLYTNNLIFVNGIFNTKLVIKEIVRCLITAMSIMPINIPLLTTIILLTGVLAMAKHQVIIRDLNSVESLGRVSVVCSDKTGTITKNEMTVKWVWIPRFQSSDGALYGVTGVGFEPSGKILSVKLDGNPNLREIITKEPETLGDGEVRIEQYTPLEYLLASGYLNNDSSITKEKVKGPDKKREQIAYKAIGDTTDASILVLFYKSKLDPEIYKNRFQLVRNYPFDSKLKRMTKVFLDKENGRYVVFTKGATEVLLPRCNYIVKDKVADIEILDEKKKEHIGERTRLFASEGYRVISFSFKYMDSLPPKGDNEREVIESDMIYLGFVAIIDPPREGVRDSVFEAKSAGIKPIMITGDSVETAKSIAMQVGIAGENDLAVEGSKIPYLTDDEFLRTTVFARVSPEHKKIIIERYKKRDQVVAMTGDGVNDALAISMADVGIAMGISGTDVAKQAADMIIADDSFTSIVVGIREGRGLFQKIRAIIFFYIAVNFAEALVYFGSSLIPGFYLLNTWQQIYIFMTAHSLPPFALIIDRLSRDVMKEKPRDTEGIFNIPLRNALMIFSLSLALSMSIAYFATYYGIIPVFDFNKAGYVPRFQVSIDDPVNWAQAKARTMLHTVAFVAECTLVISLRRLNKPIHKILKEDNYWILWPLIVLVPIAHLILMYMPETQLILIQAMGINLEVVQLTWIDWIIALALGLFPILLLESYKIWLKKHGRFI
ncbi:MAG: cation-transporting P-type ATPase [Candidatus Odinarchaeota archaeon]|nr:cation-transporting P-type ATPase [Candidatus Odinarchaeota archaeon]